ncbi:MAG: cysteine desulfurase family protein [Candidatus Krumholzibacteriota bacterium]
MGTINQADPIYLDYNATTPVDRRVADAMTPYLREHFGNPSSSHVLGQRTRAAVENARRQAASFLGAEPDGIIFTSGGTEANNHAIIGAATARRDRGRHIVTTAVEHPAVSEVCRHLESRGFSTTYVPVDENCRVDPDQVAAACNEQTVLVSVMHANNEVGTLQPVAEIAAQARQRGILSHSDCAQSAGKIPVTLDGLGVDMISVAGHKLYGPKGVGLLCLRPGLEIPNLMFGAGHEGGRRPGTENIMEIVGLGVACELAAADLDHEGPRLTALRDRLQTDLLTAFPEGRVNGHRELRLPNTLSFSVPDVTASAIIGNLPQVAVSAGAACHGDGGVTISHVLAAMNVKEKYALGTIRLSVGRMTTEQDIDAGAAAVILAVKAARKETAC